MQETFNRSVRDLKAGLALADAGVLTPDMMASGIRLLCMPVVMRTWLQGACTEPPPDPSLEVAVARTAVGYVTWSEELHARGRFAIPDLQDPATLGVLLHVLGHLVSAPGEDPMFTAISLVQTARQDGISDSIGTVVANLLRSTFENLHLRLVAPAEA